MTLAETKQKLEATLVGYGGFWAVAGGWAIDFFLDEQTREHKDIEIAAWRDEQLGLQEFFADWHCEYYRQGEPLPWRKGQTLQLPLHEIHCYRDNDELEVLLNERQDGEWIFRRNPQIRYPTERFSLTSVSGIRVIAPEIVLLYKAKNPTETDTQDFNKTFPKMDAATQEWLKSSLALIEPHHEWISSFVPEPP